MPSTTSTALPLLTKEDSSALKNISRLPNSEFETIQKEGLTLNVVLQAFEVEKTLSEIEAQKKTLSEIEAQKKELTSEIEAQKKELTSKIEAQKEISVKALKLLDRLYRIKIGGKSQQEGHFINTEQEIDEIITKLELPVDMNTDNTVVLWDGDPYNDDNHWMKVLCRFVDRGYTCIGFRGTNGKVLGQDFASGRYRNETSEKNSGIFKEDVKGQVLFFIVPEELKKSNTFATHIFYFLPKNIQKGTAYEECKDIKDNYNLLFKKILITDKIDCWAFKESNVGNVVKVSFKETTTVQVLHDMYYSVNFSETNALVGIIRKTLETHTIVSPKERLDIKYMIPNKSVEIEFLSST